MSAFWGKRTFLTGVVLELPLRPVGNFTCDGKPVVTRRLGDTLAHIIFDALRVESARDKQQPPFDDGMAI